MLRVAFQNTPDSLYTRIIRRVTGAPEHVELLFSDDTVFTTGWSTGAYWIPQSADNFQPGGWIFLDVPHVEEERVRAFCLSVDGSKYDKFGSLCYWTGLASRSRYSCCELVAYALFAGGATTAVLDACATPKQLYRQLITLYGTAKKNSP